MNHPDTANTVTELHWLCDAPSPYNTQLYQYLASCADFDLTVHYRKLALDSHPWKSGLLAGYQSRGFAKPNGIDWTLVRLALKRQAENRPRVFIVAGWNHPTAIFLLLILGLSRAKFLIWTDTPNMNRKREGIKQDLRARFLRWTFSRARQVMTSGKPAVEILKKMGAPDGRAVNFPCWIDPDKYLVGTDLPDKPKSAAQPMVFLSAGIILNDRKGHDVVVRAISKAAKQTSKPFEYRIAGTGPDQEALMSLAADLGIDSHVKLLGWTETDKLIEQMRQADVLIHPSPIHEPYGVAVIEGMASGLAVLASDCTYAGLDRVTPGVEGMIHRAGDSDELAEQMLSLIEDSQRLKKMREAALTQAREWPISRAAEMLRDYIGSSSQA